MGLYKYILGWRKWDIRKGDRVLELGSGGNPMLRSNLLADKYIDDDLERELNIVKDRPLICADIAHLPFKNSSIDFIYAAHVIEHLDDIEKSLDEIVRVGKKGVIIVPGEIFERTWDKDTHKWIITEMEGRLIFRKKCACTRLNHNLTLEKWKKIFWEIYSKNKDLLDIEFSWDKAIRFQIVECEAGCKDRYGSEIQRRSVKRDISIRAKTKIIVKIILSKIIRAIYS